MTTGSNLKEKINPAEPSIALNTTYSRLAVATGLLTEGYESADINLNDILTTTERKLYLLESLYEAGVDNWGGFDEAIRINMEKLEENE